MVAVDDSRWDRIRKDGKVDVAFLAAVDDVVAVVWCGVVRFGSFPYPALNHRSMDLTFLFASSEQTNVQVPTAQLVHKISDQEPINY